MIRCLVLTTLLSAGCDWDSGGSAAPPFTGGDVGHGAAVMAAVGCGACHVIPGIAGARGVVGPPLQGFARRSYVGGEVPNTPSNLMQWLENPQSIEPLTAMPSLGLDATQARDVAAFLYTLN